MPDALSRRGGDVVFLTNGNLNGRVIRLVADHAQETSGLRATLLSFAPLTPWPEQQGSPHRVEPRLVDLAEAERRIASARAFVYAPSPFADHPRLVRLARRLGVPSVAIIADVGWGETKLDPAEPSGLPDRVCVADPVTEELLLRRGVAERILRRTGSPHLDVTVQRTPLPPPAAPGRRVGALVNPVLDLRAPVRPAPRPELEVVRGIERAVAGLPGVSLTLRLHPRLDPRCASDLPGAALDPLEPRRPFEEFVADQHRVVGSHSTGLLVARMLGRPAASFQPEAGAAIRAELFAAWGIPILTRPEDRRSWLLASDEAVAPPLRIEELLFRPGRSLEAIAEVVGEVLSGTEEPDAVPRPAVRPGGLRKGEPTRESIDTG